ncbi:MAG: single-stranded DNA-binding protein [Candidatus Binataceae bacterium]
MAIKVEFNGRLLEMPRLHTTPGGTSLLRLTVDCGEPGDRMPMRVVIKGGAVSALHAALRPGSEIHAEGVLHGLRGVARRSLLTDLEIVAERIEIESARKD